MQIISAKVHYFSLVSCKNDNKEFKKWKISTLSLFDRYGDDLFGINPITCFTMLAQKKEDATG